MKKLTIIIERMGNGEIHCCHEGADSEEMASFLASFMLSVMKEQKVEESAFNLTKSLLHATATVNHVQALEALDSKEFIEYTDVSELSDEEYEKYLKNEQLDTNLKNC